MAFSNQG